MTTLLREPANRVSRRAITLWLLHGLVAFVLLTGAAVLVARWLVTLGAGPISSFAWWLPAAVAVLTLPFALVEPFWRYAVHRWELAGDVVYARSGWFRREWVFVPVSRIQTVDKVQNWSERLLGLATLKISTASYAGSSSIAGLDFEVAARLAGDLARRAHELRDDAT